MLLVGVILLWYNQTYFQNGAETYFLINATHFAMSSKISVNLPTSLEILVRHRPPIIKGIKKKKCRLK